LTDTTPNAAGLSEQALMSGAGAKATQPPAPASSVETGTLKTAAATPAAPAATLGAAHVALPPQVVAATNPSSTAYKIGPQDVLDVSVFNVPELSKTVQVADNGTVNLPLIGDVVASGRTAQDVEREVAKKLGDKYLKSPNVSVYIKEFNSQRVTVEGAVKTPGVFPVRTRTTLLQYVATAGGATDLAEDEVLVFREQGGKRMAAKFSLNGLRSGSIEDPVITAGDTIIVNTSALKQTFQGLMKVIPSWGTFLTLI
jgi:polysaccharide export outer membrane protein